jgi:putative zinc finger protein
MSHLDEGTLHALLDGELDLAEVSEIQKHLGSCVACGSRLQEVKQVLAEADRLVGAMEVPAAAPRARQEAPRAEPRQQPPAFHPAQEPPGWDEPPVLLVPDPIDPHVTRRRWFRGLAAAAALAGVVAGGKLISNAFQPSHPVLSERDLTSAPQPASAPAVASQEETKKPETTAQAVRPSRPQPRPAAVARKPTAAKQEVAPETTATQLADSDAGASQDSAAAADSVALAAQFSTDSAGSSELAAASATDSLRQSKSSGTEPASAEADLATRRAAAAALAELDRERRRQRANAATAALPRTPAQTEAAEPAPAPAPRPPTLEQRAQVYLRIGLDEAVKQLGGPVHVIEGMTPELIGLTRSQLIPGINSTRPVVRVVYVDARGRLILLDQQRVAAGQGPSSPAGSLRWTIGDVMLYLRGEPGPDVLRSLQARVR